MSNRLKSGQYFQSPERRPPQDIALEPVPQLCSSMTFNIRHYFIYLYTEKILSSHDFANLCIQYGYIHYFPSIQCGHITANGNVVIIILNLTIEDKPRKVLYIFTTNKGF